METVTVVVWLRTHLLSCDWLSVQATTEAFLVYLELFVQPTVDLLMAVEYFVVGQGLAVHQVRNGSTLTQRTYL